MPIPNEYWQATKDFETLLAELKARSLLTTHNQCYAMLRAVLHVFRSHVPPQQALDLAGLLPPLVRAIFIDGWDLDQPVTPFPDRQRLIDEVLAIRAPHNSAPASAIADVVAVLRAHMDDQRLHRLLDAMPAGAGEFWKI